MARAFGELWTTGLAGGSSALPLPVHIGVSLGRFAAGYALAAVCGIGLGLLFGLFPGVFDYANPVVQLLRPIAPVAWMPFIVLWFGIGDAPAVAIIFIAGFFPVLLATARAVGQIAPIYWQVADNFGMNGWQKITKIVCPAAFPQIMASLQATISTAWIFLVSGEMIGAQSGLGFLIMDCKNAIRSDALLAVMMVIGVIGLILNKAVAAIEKRVQAHWGAGSGGNA
ncbi:ABC transporter permease [Pseudoramibacter alactolyticus]